MVKLGLWHAGLSQTEDAKFWLQGIRKWFISDDKIGLHKMIKLFLRGGMQGSTLARRYDSVVL